MTKRITKTTAKALSKALQRRYAEAKERNSSSASQLYSRVSSELDMLDGQSFDNVAYYGLCDDLRRVG